MVNHMGLFDHRFNVCPSEIAAGFDLKTFDFVLLLIISNAVQNSMNAGDKLLAARAFRRAEYLLRWALFFNDALVQINDVA